MHLANKMQKTYIAIIAFLILALTGVCYAANWQTVTTITGSSTKTTDYFNVPTNEWRLTWSYTPDPQYPEYTRFYVFTYPKGEDAIYVDSVSAEGSSQTSGTSYIRADSKDYYLYIITANTPNYTIKIEYDSSTIPEYSTITLIVAIFLITGTLVAVKKKTAKQYSIKPTVTQTTSKYINCAYGF